MRINKLTLILILSLTSLFSQNINLTAPTQLENGKTQYIRDYTHQAKPSQDELDSKKIALKELAQDTLREAGIYIQSELTVNKSTKTKMKIKSTQLTAGILQVKVLEQKWQEEETSFWQEPKRSLYLKVSIILQKNDVQKKIKKLVDFKRINKKLTQSKKETKKEIKAKRIAINKLNLNKKQKEIVLAKLKEKEKQVKKVLNKLEIVKKEIQKIKQEAKNKKPSSIKQLLTSNIKTNEITLYWNESEDKDGEITGYYISYKSNADYSQEIITQDTNMILKDLEPNTGYTIQIRAKDNEDEYSDYLTVGIIQTKDIKTKKKIRKQTLVTQAIRTFKGHTDEVRSVLPIPNTNKIISGSRDKTIKLWNINTGELIRTFKGHTGGV